MSGDRYFITDQNAIYFVTFTVVDWLDVFIRESYRHQIVSDLNYCISHKGLEVYSWCLMTSHLHLIIRAQEGYRVSDIIRDLKKHSSKAIVEKIRTEPESRREYLLSPMQVQASSLEPLPRPFRVQLRKGGPPGCYVCFTT